MDDNNLSLTTPSFSEIPFPGQAPARSPPPLVRSSSTQIHKPATCNSFSRQQTRSPAGAAQGWTPATSPSCTTSASCCSRCGPPPPSAAATPSSSSSPSSTYTWQVNARCAMRLRKRIQHAEMKSAYQRRLLSDGESVRWLNHAVKKMWPICMEKIVSQLLRPIIPWFLDKFKPWIVSKASVQELYMGRDSPIFTTMRVLPETSDDDHLVLELGMNFLSAEDMSVVLAMQLHKSVGLGMTANMHLTRMHVEGKVLLGVKFVRSWPFLGRLRLCFVEPPYFQMTVKPLVGHGLDVTEFPGISGWLDKLMDTAFGQTLVEPNMLVINMEKFSSTPSENNWFNIEERPPVAYVKLEILEGLDMKPADINGLSDPYVRGRIGLFKFQTQIQRKTLSPKWFEEFKIPITSWEASNELVMEVRDKDHMFDDSLGECTVDVNELRGGQRHDKWISLKNVKKGRIHLAITIEDVSEVGDNILNFLAIVFQDLFGGHLTMVARRRRQQRVWKNHRRKLMRNCHCPPLLIASRMLLSCFKKGKS
ncbi:hypothetical protein VPH35_051276 [Triticum aestivum]